MTESDPYFAEIEPHADDQEHDNTELSISLNDVTSAATLPRGGEACTLRVSSFAINIEAAVG